MGGAVGSFRAAIVQHPPAVRRGAPAAVHEEPRDDAGGGGPAPAVRVQPGRWHRDSPAGRDRRRSGHSRRPRALRPRFSVRARGVRAAPEGGRAVARLDRHHRRSRRRRRGLGARHEQFHRAAAAGTLAREPRGLHRGLSRGQGTLRRRRLRRLHAIESVGLGGRGRRPGLGRGGAVPALAPRAVRRRGHAAGRRVPARLRPQQPHHRAHRRARRVAEAIVGSDADPGVRLRGGGDRGAATRPRGGDAPPDRRRGAAGGGPAEGRVPRDGLARASQPPQRDARLAAAAAGRDAGRAGDPARPRRHRAQRAPAGPADQRPAGRQPHRRRQAHPEDGARRSARAGGRRRRVVAADLRRQVGHAHVVGGRRRRHRAGRLGTCCPTR